MGIPLSHAGASNGLGPGVQFQSTSASATPTTPENTLHGRTAELALWHTKRKGKIIPVHYFKHLAHRSPKIGRSAQDVRNDARKAAAKWGSLPASSWLAG
jgi:hypothetical protein